MILTSDVGLPLFAASGIEIVRALKRRGFHVLSQAACIAILEHGHRRVAIPTGRSLHPDELLGLLRAAGISYADFIELLDSPRDESSVRRRTLPDEPEETG